MEGDWLVGGPIDVLRVAAASEGGERFEEFRLPPAGGSRNQTGHRGVRPRPSEAACSMGPAKVGVVRSGQNPTTNVFRPAPAPAMLDAESFAGTSGGVWAATDRH